ncbi:neuronal acetylcholine receptor subunit alpha-7-like [Xenia sp. Carnegie-2017]|uniref:neuronal acetylcholine receptor subunit alpha-7-like n=1 Tax=Xenia sp. Carnegie-2017 TaxID=2897299 RepID=UPI001F03B3DF|nr:neuronal acetylcholine receptor subunit alpha-7-like [Xenia sp. Carnegie-2017]
MSYKQLQALYWKDVALKWNSSEYGGYKHIYVSPSKVWIPDLTLYNNADENGGVMFDLNYQIKIRSDGYVRLVCPLILSSVCPINIRYFPFDTQKCELKIGFWAYDSEDLDLQMHTNNIDLSNFEANSVWEYKSVNAIRNTVNYTCCKFPFHDITYTFEFRRKPSYYVTTIIIPSILLSLLSCISFLFPAESGERVSLVTSVMLGLFVFMLIVNERTPVTSDVTPMLTQFFNCIQVHTVLSLLATAIILRLNHGPYSDPVPRNLAVIRDFIARVLCVKSPKNFSTNSAAVNFGNTTIAERQITSNDLQQVSLGSMMSKWKQLEDDKIVQELQKITTHFNEQCRTSELEADWQFTMRPILPRFD